MSRVRSKRIFGPTLLTSTLSSVYVVDGHQTAVIRSLILANNSGAATAVRLTINGTASSNGLLWDAAVPIGGYVVLQDVVLSAGDELRGRSLPNNTVTITAMGSLLNGAWGEIE